jgi:hypothetical protein
MARMTDRRPMSAQLRDRLVEEFTRRGLSPGVIETAVTSSGRPVLHAADYHRGEGIAFHVVRR